MNYRDQLCGQLDEMLEVVSRPMAFQEIVASIRGYAGKRFARASEDTAFEALHHLQRIGLVLKVYSRDRPPVWVSKEALRIERLQRGYEEYQRKNGVVS